MPKIAIEIRNCRDCSHKKSTNFCSSDGWERMEDWMCNKMEPPQRIQGAVEWHEEAKIEIPPWCPIKVDE